MCDKCINNLGNCHFSNFLKGKEYYVKDEKGDCYCIFHAPKNLKDNFTYAKNELFLNAIGEYIDTMINYGRNIDFSNVVFHLPIRISNKSATLLYFYFETIGNYIVDSNINIDFTNAEFFEYVDIRNIRCKRLIFKDTKFHKGGALKNRGETNRLFIEDLIFRPFALESDFVIDIGAYVNNDGRLEINEYGTIKKIEFENHKEGKGFVYFVGINSATKSADFRNRKLDNVSFQNCDLSKCYFLNSKVDKTEFRNCLFPFVQQGLTMSIISRITLSDIINPLVGLIIIAVVYLLSINKFNIQILKNIEIFYFIIPFFVILIMQYIVHLMYFSEWIISNVIPENKYQNINKIKTLHYHKGTADEEKIKDQLDLTVPKIRSKQIQETIASLESLYKQLKLNFIRFDYQLSGDFFFSQRLMEVYGSKYKDNLFNRNILILHYGINGFGEKFIKPILLFLTTIIIFSNLYTPNKDFIATNQAPNFLLDPIENKSSSIDAPYLKIQSTKKYVSNNLNDRVFFAHVLLNNKKTNILYSVSQFISPFTSKNRLWFKTVSLKAVFLNTIQAILLYLFFGAFLLALKNRIKR